MALAKRYFRAENTGRAGLSSRVCNGQAYLFGGHDGQKPLKTVQSFTPEESSGNWKDVPNMLARRSYCSASELEGKIYVVGGSADGRTLNTFEVLDPLSGQWDQWFTKPPMGVKRTMHAAAVAEGAICRLYVAGGFDGIRDLASAEVYDPRSNSWSGSMDPMAVARSYHVMASSGGNVYAIGGQERQVKDESRPRAHRSMEVFELYCERWLPMPPMAVGRIGPACSVFPNDQGEELIYVTGGSDGTDVLTSMEVFNTKKQSWEELPSMSIPRVGHASFALAGRIYVVGGLDGKVVLDTYEAYDIAEKKWLPPQRLGPDESLLPAVPPEPEDF